MRSVWAYDGLVGVAGTDRQGRSLEGRYAEAPPSRAW